MKYIYFNIIVLLLALSGTTSAVAQEISGKIVDVDLCPIEGATVVMQAVDSTFVDAVITNKDGLFTFSKYTLPFILSIQHLSYVDIQKTFHEADLGVITMSPMEHHIKDVVVTAQRPYVKVEGEKLIYETKSIIDNTIVNSAWDLLSKLPGISVNTSSISLIGTNKVTVILDGKNTTLTQEQLYNILTNTPAERIAKTEIIYNAPPQYHVNGAVVNLVMHRPSKSSIEGQITANYANQYYNEGGINANIRVASPKSTFDVMYGINRKNKMQYSEIESHHRLYDQLYNINQSEKISSKFWGHDIRAAFDYKFNDKNVVSIAYTAMLTPNKESQSHTIGNFQNSNNKKDANTNLHNISVNSQLGCGLHIGVDYTNYRSENQQNLMINYNDNRIGHIISNSSQTIDKYYIYADQSHATDNGWNFGYGASYTYAYDRDNQIYELAENVSQTQNTESKLNEHKADIYFSVSKQFNIGLYFNASAKGEYYQIGEYQKLSLYPQFSINYSKNPKHIYQLGLSTDKTHPKYWSLSSSISYIDGYSEIHGTPGIRPATNYSLNAAYIYDRKYIVSVFYSYIDDYFAQSPYQSTNRLALIYKNMNWDYMQNAGLSIIVPINVGNWLRSRMVATGMYMSQRCDDFYDIPFNRGKFVFVGNIENTFAINKKLLFELNANIQTPAIQGVFDIKTTASVNVGMKYNFAKDKMSLSLFCNDIFNTASPILTVNHKGQDLIMDNSFYSRMVYIKFSLKFGGFKSKAEKQIDMSRFGH